MKGCTRYKVKLITGLFINSMSCLNFPHNHYQLRWKWAARSRRSNEGPWEMMRTNEMRVALEISYRPLRCVGESFSQTLTCVRKSVFIMWSLVVNIERILCVLSVFTVGRRLSCRSALACIKRFRLPLWKREYMHVMSEIWRLYQKLMIDRRASRVLSNGCSVFLML